MMGQQLRSGQDDEGAVGAAADSAASVVAAADPVALDVSVGNDAENGVRVVGAALGASQQEPDAGAVVDAAAHVIETAAELQRLRVVLAAVVDDSVGALSQEPH
uniref:Uncharacterized protein n=1 Tax=Pseudictyota dubia TaxID=2749911 RepID=A0A7R9YZT9_9STRA|mmetsp:Transcript_1515/g.2575  ORF Transcript_1515/g.2575 Transcript_1515/m.2575 type:complete len:104 (+) Transcript_1515:318-629(+)